MKKLMAVLTVLLLAWPAFAADWSFYGSERVATWYVSRDYGDSINAVNGDDNDAGTQWYFQGNSRFGAKVKADKVSGQVELATQASNNGNSGDGAVNTRRAFGVWQFSENAWLKVGKDFSPVTDTLSNQVFDEDKDLYGEGNFYGKRPSGITLGLGNFQLALLNPQQGDTGGIGSSNSGILNPITNPANVNFQNSTASQTTATGNPNVYLPKFEAAYKLSLGSGYIYPYAGFQWYQVKSFNTGTTNSQVTSDLDVISYVVGFSTSWNIGAFSIGGQLSYGQNEGISGWANGYNNANSQLPVLKTGGDDIANVHTIQAMIIPALRVTDTLRFEAGLGYRQDNADGAPGFSQKDDSWAAYLQATITLAPGLYLGPEVGYIDFMDNRAGNDEGYEWYAGAKWQIDF
jgi:hypothetical protein